MSSGLATFALACAAAPLPTACTREGFGCGSEPVADAEVDVMEQDLSLQDIVGT